MSCEKNIGNDELAVAHQTLVDGMSEKRLLSDGSYRISKTKGGSLAKKYLQWKLGEAEGNHLYKVLRRCEVLVPLGPEGKDGGISEKLVPLERCSKAVAA